MACRKQSDFLPYIPSWFKVVAYSKFKQNDEASRNVGIGLLETLCPFGARPGGTRHITCQARDRSSQTRQTGGLGRHDNGKERKCTKQSESVLLELSINKAPINALQIHSCHELLVSPI